MSPRAAAYARCRLRVGRGGLLLALNQLSDERITGGMRGQARACSDPEEATACAGSTRAAETDRGPPSMIGGATMARALAIKATTLSKSSSSQYPPSHVGSGGSAYAIDTSATTSIA